MKKILIVEDDKPTLKLMGMIIKDILGVQAVEANGFDEAKAALKKDRFDLVVLDYFLDDGYDATQLIEFIDQQIPILLMTASNNVTEDFVKSTLHISKFLRKPFSLEDLEKLLK